MAGYQGRRTAAAPARRSPQRGKKAPAMTAGEKRRLAQLLLSGGFFVLLVAVKLLFPAKMAQWSDGISAAMERCNLPMETISAPNFSFKIAPTVLLPLPRSTAIDILK